MAHRIAVMDHGRVVQVAPPAELYEQPNSRWVAEFVGDVNLIEGVVLAGDAAEIVMETAAGQRFRAPAHGTVGRGESVWLALRPEKLRITSEVPPDDAGNRLAGRVWDIGYLGDTSIYKIKLENGSIMRASVANAGRTRQPAIGWEEQVWLSWPSDFGVVLTR